MCGGGGERERERYVHLCGEMFMWGTYGLPFIFLFSMWFYERLEQPKWIFRCISGTVRMWAFKGFFKQTQFYFISGFIPFHLFMTVTFAYSLEALILHFFSNLSYCFAVVWCYLEFGHDFFFCPGKDSTQMLILIFLHVTLEIFDICTELTWM